MRQFKKISLWVALGIISITNSYADLMPTKPYEYYQLNGGSDLSMPPVQPSTLITVGGDVNSNLGYSCDGFNPAISISNTLNNIEGSMEGMAQNIINSATAAAGSLPMYELQKMDPGLYSLIQNAMNGASDIFNIKMTSCQQALDEIKNGKSPYQDWFSISDSQGWLSNADAAAQGQDVDINDAANDVTQNGPQYGVPWVHPGQNSGGSIGDQVPIKVISDVAIAGYNIMIDPTRSLDDLDAPDPTDNPNLTSFFPNPTAAGQFAALVLGDISITTQASNAAQGTNAGVGLVPILTSCPNIANTDKTCVKTIQQNMVNLVSSGQTGSPSDYDAVSANGLMVTPQVIEGLSNLDATSQQIYINRIAEDVAIQNLLDEALMLRRILIAGSEAQVVQNVKPALTSVDQSIDELNKDINDLLFEHNVRKDMTSSTMRNLMGQMGSNNAASAASENQPEPTAPTNNGAVYTTQGGQKP